MIEVRLLQARDTHLLENVADGVFDNPVDRALTGEFLADPRHHLAVACDTDARIVGMASAVHYVHPDKRAQLFINEVGVAPTHQSQGIGRRLIAALLELAGALHCTEAWVATEPGNHAARALYAGAGGQEEPAPFVMYTFPVSHAPSAGGSATPHAQELSLRPAVAGDAFCLSVLAMQVFLDTYATDGIRPALAREVHASYSERAFTDAIASADARVCVAEIAGHLVGFAHVTVGATHELAPAGAQAELLRLYVQEPFTARYVGTRLLEEAERLAAEAGASVLWLTPWVHNQRALRFYARRGYQDYGLTWFTFEGESHANRLLARQLAIADNARAWSAPAPRT